MRGGPSSRSTEAEGGLSSWLCCRAGAPARRRPAPRARRSQVSFSATAAALKSLTCYHSVPVAQAATPPFNACRQRRCTTGAGPHTNPPFSPSANHPHSAQPKLTHVPRDLNLQRPCYALPPKRLM